MKKTEWEPVRLSDLYFADGYGQYGRVKVGIKLPKSNQQKDSEIVWFGSYAWEDGKDENRILEQYVREICRHMNSLIIEERGVTT